MRKAGSLLLYFFIGLIIVGLATQLIKSPGQFLTSILILVGISFIMFLIFRAILNKRQGPADPEDKKFKKAVKQSQEKHGKPVTHKAVKKSNEKTTKSKARKRKKSHLRVIKGYKDSPKTKENKEIKKDSNK